MDDKKIIELINKAKDIATKNCCCKYSNFTVGASLLTSDGIIYTGFNVENDGIESICAERTAMCKALTEGEKDFVAIAIVAKKLNDTHFTKVLPCGYCRQFLSEYTNSNFLIYTYDEKTKKVYSYKLKDLLPETFRFEES